MPNNKKDPQSGSKKSSMGNQPDREFESHGKNKNFDQGQQAGNPGKGTGTQGKTEDDEMNTAGGRQGQFSDKDRGSEAQWSPGSKRPLDE